MALQVLDDNDHDPQHQNNKNKPTTTTTAFKNFCKICNRGFGCGRALGGHMRAHGINGAEADDVTTGRSNINDGNDQDSSAGTADWVDEEPPPGSNKRMYALRTNPNRLKSSCRVCENCGLEFSSWKSFLEHGKCSSNVENNNSHHYMNMNMNTMGGGSDEEDGFGGWSKGKRSKRSKYGSFLNLNGPLSEEEDLANCLVMLSSARVDNHNNHNRSLVLETDQESNSVSATKEEEHHRKPEFFAPKVHDQQIDYKAKGVASSKGLFECKACKKVFNSHQALGGHRASHKKVKGCYAAKNDDNFDENVVEDDVLTNDNDYLITSKSTFEYETSDTPVEKRKSKVHECSICHRIFSSGQALGGHKRCHWVTSSSNSSEQHQISSAAGTSISFHQFNDSRANSFNIHQRVPKFNDQSQHNKQKPLDHGVNVSVNGRGDGLKGLQKDFENVDTRICLQPWISLCANENINHNDQQNQQHQQQQKKDNDESSNDHSKVVKLAKLSDLKDDDSSTSWLQVGIGSSTSNVGKDS